MAPKNKMFNTLAAVAVGTIAVGSFVASAANAYAVDAGQQISAEEDKKCSGDKECSADKDCSGDTKCSGEGQCSADKKE